MSWQRWVCAAMVFGIGVAGVGLLWSQEPAGGTGEKQHVGSGEGAGQGNVAQRKTVADSRKLMTGETTKAIELGTSWLASQQQTDGSFGSRGSYHKNVGVSALAGIAFLAGGHLPGRGKYGSVVEKTVDYLLDQTGPNGFIRESEVNYHGPMYGHGFAVLFLAEVYGESEHPQLDRKLRQAVQLIVSAQNKQGGWRYQPDSEDADLSVTVCQVMALRAARNSGISVPKEVIDRAVAYVRRCQNTDGGYRYQLLRDPESRFPLTAAALVALNSAGIYEGPEIERGLRFQKVFKTNRQRWSPAEYFFYGHYYAVQAAWQAGGTYWEEWYTGIRDTLVEQQMGDGSWNDQSQVGDEYATSMALIILQTPNNYLPIFDR